MTLRLLVCFVLLSSIYVVSAWKGNIEVYRRWTRFSCNRCLCRYSWGCSLWRSYWCTRWVSSYRCKAGWRHLGDRNCNVPICYPGCNGGKCVRPNTCKCPTTKTGRFCQTLTCSYQLPCYPGNCMDTNKCNCTVGFTPSTGTGLGRCMKMGDEYEPYIGQSTTVIANIRAVDQKLIYYFQVDGDPEDGETNVVWSNQNEFNTLSFMFESMFSQPEELPDRPAYVHEIGLGIIHGKVDIRVTDFEGVPVSRAKMTTNCDGAPDPYSPVKNVYNCTIQGQDFRTNMEHGDTLTVRFSVTSGGFRQMLNLDNNGQFLPRDRITGPSSTKETLFKFDLIAPKHCSETDSDRECSLDEDILGTNDEFTKDPIRVYWKGWYDDKYGAGMWQYYLELHQLKTKDATQHLTEVDPIGPMATALVMHAPGKTMEHTFTPEGPGVYSVLLEARDMANNSRICRRIVTYDPVSEITLNTGGPGLHVTTATEDSGYRWQSAYNEVTGRAPITVSWKGFFQNTAHEEGKYLNAVDDFPVQFNNLEDDGILFARKFVASDLDDNVGERTLAAIPHLQGIVKFEYGTETTDRKLPASWNIIAPLSDEVSIAREVEAGEFVKIWVRAHDAMGNIKTESTKVGVDITAPIVDEGSIKLTLNDNSTSTPFSFPSRVEFEAYDVESGVKTLEISVTLRTPDKQNKVFTNTVAASLGEDPSLCYRTNDPSLCFLRQQTVFLDNCWFMASTRSDLVDSTASIDITIYNQAGLKRVINFDVDNVANLHGLDYVEPRDLRIENIKQNSFRVAWDLPEKGSCYGNADVILALVVLDANGQESLKTYNLPSTETSFEIGGLEPGNTYEVIYRAQLGGGGTTEGLTLKASTAAEEEQQNLTGPIVGAVVGVLVLIILVVVILVVLIRRGVITPPERVQRAQRAVTKRYRETFYGVGRSAETGEHVKRGHVNKTYDNNADLEEIYIYGDMELDDKQMWHLNRDDIVFESLIKAGHFANVYKARINNYPDAVAVKTLKEQHTPADELLMKAKINFTGSKVGSHQNILKFVGAVTLDNTMGPMIVYELCENGSLKDYLEQHRGDVTIQLQENLFQIGLAVAKGMEYLAAQGITHKRLAARNILLTFVNEAKIAGFGPQPADDGEEEEGKKRERIPIKWMAPECTKSSKDADEKSDVWSYAVVLWEIFSLGATPYGNTKARDIPAKLKKGERLQKPEQCDDVWYNVMQRCWSYQPDRRPTFTDIRAELDSLFVASNDGEEYYYYRR